MAALRALVCSRRALSLPCSSPRCRPHHEAHGSACGRRSLCSASPRQPAPPNVRACVVELLSVAAALAGNAAGALVVEKRSDKAVH
jgi:hypothetical protein